MNTTRLSRGGFAAFSVAFVLAFGVAGAQAPIVTRLAPEVAKPGDLLIIEGSGLGSSTQVQFNATVGGFVGVLSVTETVIFGSANRLEVIVPAINAFVPPSPFGSSDPVGSVEVVDIFGAHSNQQDFLFLEAAFGLVTTVGTGSTQSTGIGKPVVSASIPGMAPFPGNSNFTLKLENANVGAPAVLLIGAPAAQPYVPVNDGLLVTELNNPAVITIFPFFVDGQGEVSVNLPIPGPGPFNLTVMCQWVVFDPLVPLGVALSNGFQFVL